MCGIAAMIGLNGLAPVEKTIVDMVDTIKHRGPDEKGLFLSESVGFGFRRLSILDLSLTGHQPMFSQDRSKVIVFNGEIYNYIELRKELISLGHQFSSTGDTEVLLHAYMQWGSECLSKLNGMWAFLIYDRNTNKIFGSRDRLGKKPLYRYKAGDYVFFVSEIKSILVSGFYKGGTNWKKASEFLFLNNLNEVPQGEDTFFQDIFQIPEGSAFEMDLHGDYREWQFWSLPGNYDTVSDDEAPEQFQSLFYDSVNLRLRSDVPLGIFLSGGLDSTSVICSVADILNKDFHDGKAKISAFSYHAPEYDETPFIKDTIRQTGADLFQFKPTAGYLWDRLKDFLWFQDEPVHSFASIIFFELCRQARTKNIKVILAGGGADEYLAGYSPYFRTYWYSIAKKMNLQKLLSETKSYCDVHGDSQLNLLLNVLKTIVSMQVRRDALIKKKLQLRQLNRIKSNPWFIGDLANELPASNAYNFPETLGNDLKRSVLSSPLPLYLREDDRSTMAHSIEGRSPFLDYRLVELAFTISDGMKIRGPWNKFILREAMKGKIPESVRTRPDKMGFSIPQNKWFSNTLYEPMRDLISSRAFRERGIYNTSVIEKDLESQKRGLVNLSNRFFNLLQFELWNEVTHLNQQ